MHCLRWFAWVLTVAGSGLVGAADPLPWLRVADDRKGFVETETGQPFVPWGVNYDHDETGRLLEDYWDAEWPAVEGDFAEIRELGANAVRIHLQFGKFMDAVDKPNEAALQQLDKLVKLAEANRLYLNLTGLACYHKQDVPAWYDALDETQRWAAQANFWRAVAGRVKDSPAIFCLDLMNEPVVPGGRRADRDWLGPAFAGKHFVQVITLDQAGRPRPEVAKQWIDQLVAAIREVNQRHLITVGLVDWSLDRPGLTSGFVPQKIAGQLDFLCVHLYPERGKVDEALQTLQGFQIGKPVVIEEMFPLKCSPQELDEFVERSSPQCAGWFSFYWGKEPARLKGAGQFVDALMLQWLDVFQQRGAKLRTTP